MEEKRALPAVRPDLFNDLMVVLDYEVDTDGSFKTVKLWRRDQVIVLRVASTDVHTVQALDEGRQTQDPVPLIMSCPACGERHVDGGAFAHKPHHTHACQHCGMCWRPAVVCTVGVQFLPGYKDR